MCVCVCVKCHSVSGACGAAMWLAGGESEAICVWRGACHYCCAQSPGFPAADRWHHSRTSPHALSLSLSHSLTHTHTHTHTHTPLALCAFRENATELSEQLRKLFPGYQQTRQFKTEPRLIEVNVWLLLLRDVTSEEFGFFNQMNEGFMFFYSSIISIIFH